MRTRRPDLPEDAECTALGLTRDAVTALEAWLDDETAADELVTDARARLVAAVELLWRFKP